MSLILGCNYYFVHISTGIRTGIIGIFLVRLLFMIMHIQLEAARIMPLDMWENVVITTPPFQLFFPRCEGWARDYLFLLCGIGSAWFWPEPDVGRTVPHLNLLCARAH